jgi:hypothetical protein
MIHPASTTRPKPASAENRRASQKAGPISELGVHARQIGNSEKPSAQTSSLISAAVGLVAPRCWSKAPRAFLTSSWRNPGSRSKLKIPCRSSVAELTWIVPPPTGSSVADHSQRWLISQSAHGRVPARLIDFGAIDHAKRRLRLCAHRRNLDAFWNE